MTTLPFGTDILAGTQTLYHEDPADGSVTIETFQDVECVVEEAKGKYNQFDERASWKGDLHQVASIPMPVIMQLQKDGILEDQKRFKAWLNSRDQRVFRTRPGII